MTISTYFKSIGLIAALGLAACATDGQWETSYADVNDPVVSKKWRVVAVDVRVPESLTVSEKNSYAPNADIVWREEAFGDRHEQVDEIITQAATKGAKVLRGSRKVKLIITVRQFHALTEKARAVLTSSGVHNISFSAQVLDAKTNKPLSSIDDIRADLVAYVGDQAIAAESQGLTQRVRITAHVADVIAGWLGHGGKDVRGSFKRNGR